MQVTLHLNETFYNNSIASKSAKPDTTLGTITHQKVSHIQHRSHLLVRSVTPRDTGLYRCDSDLTGEASVQVYVVPPEDLMKSLHLHGAVEQSDSSKILRNHKVETPHRSSVTKSDTHSSFTSRVDDSHGSNSFYDHPTKSHSQNYKNYKMNQSVDVRWMISSSVSTSSSVLNVYRASFITVVVLTKIFTNNLLSVSDV